MDNLLNVFGSFNPGWKGKKRVDDFVSIIKNMVIPSYSFLHGKVEDNKAVFPGEWSRIVLALKDAAILALFAPPEYGRQKA